MSDLAIGILGGAGRMGRALVRAVTEAKGAYVVGAVDAPGNPEQGKDLGVLAGLEPLGVSLTDDVAALFARADVIIDFTVPKATVEHARLAAKTGTAYVVGTTGLEPEQQTVVTQAAGSAAVVQAANFSLGVNLTIALTQRIAQVLDDSFDIEIVEMHHRHKVDAPSGTALKMGEVIAQAQGRKLADCAVYTREGITGERDPSSIGFATIRGGDIVGDHTVLFAGTGERIEISHKSSSRSTYAQGSLRAVRFLAGKQNGMFDMFDVLGLR
jgi:4-hydroxy-tetrahydrodipicolinate reductase